MNAYHPSGLQWSIWIWSQLSYQRIVLCSRFPLMEATQGLLIPWRHRLMAGKNEPKDIHMDHFNTVHIHHQKSYGTPKALHGKALLGACLPYILRLPHHVVIATLYTSLLYLHFIFFLLLEASLLAEQRARVDFCLLLLFTSKPTSKDTRDEHILYF